MINVIPVLLLNTLTPNTTSNGYNYTTTYSLKANFNTLNIMDGTGQGRHNLCNTGVFYIEGRCYLNNTQSYRFDVDLFGFTIHYYDESVDLNFDTYGSNDETNGFYFTDTDNSLVFSSSIDYSAYNNNFYVSLNSNSSIPIYATGLLSEDYFNDYVYDIGTVESMIISNTWVIDFANDSNTVDSFERSIDNAIKASEIPNNQAYDMGYTDGHSDGYIEGYGEGENYGRREGRTEGRTEGYNDGYADGLDTDGTAAAIYAGIIATGMIPIQFFLSIFNFEIFGINLTGLVTSLMSVCIVLIVIKRTFAIHEDS